MNPYIMKVTDVYDDGHESCFIIPLKNVDLPYMPHKTLFDRIMEEKGSNLTTFQSNEGRTGIGIIVE